jgi:RNA polymerase sigma-70 factor, ECF subfamily
MQFCPSESAGPNQLRRGTLSKSLSQSVPNPLNLGRRRGEPRKGTPAIDFADLYITHHGRVLSWCFRIVRNAEDARDLTQESFVQIMRKLHTFNGESTLSTWLYRVVINTVLMWLRKKRIPQTSLDEILAFGDQALGHGCTWQNLSSAVKDPISRIYLESAVHRLPAGYVAILRLHDVEGYRHQEIARMMGLSVGTSKSQLHRARRRLRGLLNDGEVGKERLSQCGNTHDHLEMLA